MSVIPRESKSKVTLALKQFAKETGAPEDVIMNDDSEKKSQEVKQFLHRIGTALRVLEKGTPLANRALLQIGLLKEVVIKDMKEVNSLRAF